VPCLSCVFSALLPLRSQTAGLDRRVGDTHPKRKLASPPDHTGAGFYVGIPMTIQELTDEMNRFVEAMGWYREDSPWSQTPRNIAISLALEAAEVLEHFQWGERADSDALAGELADVALYLLQLAYLTGIDLEQAILGKLAINYNRDWSEE